jgi:hypothetical protein
MGGRLQLDGNKENEDGVCFATSPAKTSAISAI